MGQEISSLLIIAQKFQTCNNFFRYIGKEILNSCKKTQKNLLFYIVFHLILVSLRMLTYKIDLLKIQSVGFSDHTLGIEASILSLKYNPK